jgi:hypothetical protein
MLPQVDLDSNPAPFLICHVMDPCQAFPFNNTFC